MSRSILALLVTASVPMAVVAADERPDGKAPIALSIAIPVHHGQRSLNEYNQFHVLVTNVSDKPVRLWTDRYSWGYDSLSFELLQGDGKVTPIIKKPRGWDKNFPDWLELQPGESYVLNVEFYSARGQAIWENVPSAAEQANKPMLVKLRAVYEIRPDEQSQKLGVWTGKVESPVETYAIW